MSSQINLRYIALLSLSHRQETFNKDLLLRSRPSLVKNDESAMIFE